MMVVVTEPMISPEESNQEGNKYSDDNQAHFDGKYKQTPHIVSYLVFIQCKWSLTF